MKSIWQKRRHRRFTRDSRPSSPSDVPGYEEISSTQRPVYRHDELRLWDQGTRALLHVINMPDISQENLRTLLHRLPDVEKKYATIFSQLFHDLN